MHTVSLTHQLVAIQDDFDLDKIIESGQCFRPQKLSDGRYRFLSGGALLYLTPLGDGQYDAAWYGSDREYWADYFDLGRNYAALRCSLAGQSSYLDKSLDFGQGIRVLHQDPWEMLITFLISQRKSIPAIRTAVEHLARCCGEPLSAEGDEVFLFPTPQQLCGLSEAQLMGCGLGYRTRYIQKRCRSGFQRHTRPRCSGGAARRRALFPPPRAGRRRQKGSKLRLPLWLWPYRDGSY